MKTSMSLKHMFSTPLLLTLGLTLTPGCSGGLKAGGKLQLDAKSGLSAKLDTKATTKKTDEPKKEGKPRPAGELLEEALVAPHRSEESRARDKYRHPKETLAFFGLRSDMKVLEVEPGAGGWYTEILAPVLRPHGTYVTTNFDATGPKKSPLTKAALAFQGKLDQHPDVYDKVQIVTLTKEYELGDAGSVDLVVTFRNSHLWKQDKIEDRVYGAMFEVLKPGGVLGIVQHRACAGDKASRTFSKGYLPQPYVIERVEKAGFVFEADSHVNANSFDTRNYPKGVWTLPPSLALGDKDREKYEKIGESDRMTLRFRKPEAAPEADPEPPDEAPSDEAAEDKTEKKEKKEESAPAADGAKKPSEPATTPADKAESSGAPPADPKGSKEPKP